MNTSTTMTKEMEEQMENKKEFKKLLGNRIYLSLPPENKNNLHISEEVKEELRKENIKKLQRLTVYAVGESINWLNEGDEVMIDPSAIQKAFTIPLSDEKSVVCVSSYDIAHIW